MAMIVLLIEDNPDTARMVEKVLAPHGHTVLWANTGLGGLKMARTSSPSLVLVDLDLPDIDGKVIVNQLRALPYYAHLPIVAFTADNAPRAKRMALAFGCDDLINKPIDTRAFPNIVEGYIRSKTPTPNPE